MTRNIAAPLFAVALASIAALPARAQTSTTLPGGDPPLNVLFILCDDHRFDCFGAAGHPFLETPHLDAMARRGAMLTILRLQGSVQINGISPAARDEGIAGCGFADRGRRSASRTSTST